MKSLVLFLISVANGCALTLAADPATAKGVPFTDEAYWATVMNYPRPGSLHGVVSLDATDHYITANGLHLENQGLMLQPLVKVSTPLWANPTEWLSSVSFTAGGWGTWHSNEDAAFPRDWQEVDVFGGLSAQFARVWTASLFYTAYLSQTDAFPASWDLAMALTLDDTRWLGAFALHPFLEFKRQTEGSMTVSFVPELRDESYSFRLGVAPLVQFQHFRLETPAFLTVVPEGFFQRATTQTVNATYFGYDYAYQVYDGRPAEGGVGLLSVVLKATAPVLFMTSSQLQTSVYGAAQFYHLVNEGLLDGNQVLTASARREADLLQFHLGMSFAF